MPDFSRRDTTPELMDTEVVSFEDFRLCLEQLADANRLSLAYRPTFAFLEKLHRESRLPKDRRFVIADIGSGYGDTLRLVDAWAQRHGLAVELVGVDLNPWSARAAAEATPPGRPIQWVTQNLFDYAPESGVDIVMSSLFTHHLRNPDVVRFLAWMERTARIGWLVNDLQRHRVPYYALKWGFPLLRRHRFMQHDGPVSVASAFTRADWELLLDEAGLKAGTAKVTAWMPFRLAVTRIKEVAA